MILILNKKRNIKPWSFVDENVTHILHIFDKLLISSQPGQHYFNSCDMFKRYPSISVSFSTENLSFAFNIMQGSPTHIDLRATF